VLFEKEMVSVRILDVVELKQRQISRNVSGRRFDALSFRMHSDVRLQSGAQNLSVHDNTVTFIPAGLPYSRTGVHDELIAIHFYMADVTEKQMEVFQPEDAAQLRELFCRILDCWRAKESGYQYRCTAILYGILSLCCHQTEQGQTDRRIQPSVDYLEQNWNHPEVTMGRIAEQSFMSEVYFRRLFKEQFGISPQKYLIRLRVEKAAELIHTGYYSLKEVASLCGWRDSKYFSVEFKRIKGCTPSAYKKGFA